jgi:hypothetical protein
MLRDASLRDAPQHEADELSLPGLTRQSIKIELAGESPPFLKMDARVEPAHDDDLGQERGAPLLKKSRW